MSDEKKLPGPPPGVEQRQEEIDVPPLQGPWCPLHRAYVSVQNHCAAGCEYFMGLIPRVEGDAPFSEKYNIYCGLPEIREIRVMKV